MSEIDRSQAKPKVPLPLWQAILLIILITFGLVFLFGILIYLFVNGAQLLRLPLIVNLGIIVIISGIFAWLLKRITDIISGMSHFWFSEEQDNDQQF